MQKMTEKTSCRKRFNTFFYYMTISKHSINIHNAIEWHHMDNNTTFMEFKYIYSRCIFDCNQLDL